MNKSTLIPLMLASVLALPLLGRAQEGMPLEGERPPHGAGFGGRHGEMHGGRAGMHFLHGLELSESQEDKLFQLMHSQAPYLREQERAHDKAVRALHEMGNADKFDDAAAAKLAQAAAQAQANLMLAHIRSHQKVLALLTPEQRKQLDERKAHPQRGGFHER
ncbi:Spy/CpxP family protein refolding chaperone [Pseudoduganella violaceinigra]|uniref:Spy/CpxP family protein refolding chaperone n=1 Tax=Pseudoduganella violaceinigra TaxID=246602 RepID=UPI00040646E7|nr:Spy/CpxP family protein refolding chaperone [Pseudoduganella violaceinigra]